MAGQGPVQLVKIKSTTQTFPKRSDFVNGFPSCVVKLKSGTDAIGGSTESVRRSPLRKVKKAPPTRRVRVRKATSQPNVENRAGSGDFKVTVKQYKEWCKETPKQHLQNANRDRHYQEPHDVFEKMI